MKRCPITYKPISIDREFSEKGVRLLSRQAQTINPFPFTVEEQLSLARDMAAKMSIQGVQPKISARFNGALGDFIPINRNGRYILKSQNQLYPYLPENENLSMKLAALAGCKTPLHGLIRGSDSRFIYFIRRFDRAPLSKKLAVEDFSQLAGMSRETKYNYSIEKVVELLDRYMTFPQIEKAKIFRLVLVNFLLGNEDAHLKNFSVISRNGKHELSPCYDIVNTTLALGDGVAEESALPLRGKKRRFKKDDFFVYLGIERLGLPDRVIDSVRDDLLRVQSAWRELISWSFLPENLRDGFQRIVDKRIKRVL